MSTTQYEEAIRDADTGVVPYESPNALAVLADVERRVAVITTIAEVKELRDQVDALRHYLQQSKRGLAAQNACARVKILAERRAGELLRDVERERGKGGGRGQRQTSFGSRTKFQQALKDAGVSSSVAHDWQLLAAFPLTELEAYFARQNATGREIVSRDIYGAVYDDIIRRRREVKEQPGTSPEPAQRDSSTCTESELRGAGLTTEQSLERYRLATVKQVVMFFDGVAYVRFVRRLARVMEKTGAKNHTEALIQAVLAWEQLHPENGENQSEPA
jgi:hypothetical protein